MRKCTNTQYTLRCQLLDEQHDSLCRTISLKSSGFPFHLLGSQGGKLTSSPLRDNQYMRSVQMTQMVSPAAEKFYVSSSQNTSPNKIDTFHLSHFVGQFVTMRDYWLKFLTMCSLVLCVFAMHFGGPVRVGPVQRQWRRLISRRAAAEWPCEAVTALQMRRSPCRALSRSPLPAALFGRLRICHSQRCLLTCHLRLWQSVCLLSSLKRSIA
jgi:hypothetical protein